MVIFVIIVRMLEEKYLKGFMICAKGAIYMDKLVYVTADG